MGPFLIPARRYRDFLENVLPGFVEDKPLAMKKRLWLQHEGARAQCGEGVRQWLNVTRPGT